MTHIEAMKQWLGALELCNGAETVDGVVIYTDKEITSLRQAIKDAEGQENALQALHTENERLGLYRDAYAEQEPVAWVNKERNTITWDKLYPDMDALYTHPPQRTEDKS